ncbi:hypothetical protein G6F65_019775 [Rhizopus arrhizus]|nr:hypothetical protein G6F65_019775 [Rhizopus arrhizus]
MLVGVGTGAGARAFVDQVRELVELHADERGAEHEGHAQPAQHCRSVMAVHCQHGLAVGDAGDQQQEGFGHHERQREQVLAGGAACVGGAEHRVRGEQRTEQHQVGHEVDPHAEHLHAALLMAVVVCVVVLVRRRIAGQLRAGQQVHARTSFSLARLAASVRATSSELT